MKDLALPPPRALLLILAGAALGCSSGTSAATTHGSGAGGGSTGSLGSGGGAATAGHGGSGGGAATGNGGGLGLDAGNLDAGSGMTPVRMIPNLTSITFYETTGTVNPYTFLVDGPELSAKLADPLGDGNDDIAGAATEYYDVYYSDGQGNFQLDGSYLTISGVFLQALPAGGGLNLAEIALNFSGATTEYGNYVASFVALGDNADPSSVPLCIDGNLMTCTTMGNTIGTSERLRLTLGFLSSSGPPQ